MNAKVELVESETIWLLKLDSDCVVISETEDVNEEFAIELQELKLNVNGKSKATLTMAPICLEEKEQTNPQIVKVFILIFKLLINLRFYNVSAINVVGEIMSSNYLGFVW